MIYIDIKGMTYKQSVKCRQYLIAKYGEDYVSKTCFGLNTKWLKEYKYLELYSNRAVGADYASETVPPIHWKQFFALALNFPVPVTHRTRKLQ